MIKERSPIMAKRENLIAELREDNFGTYEWFIMVSEDHISIVNQAPGGKVKDAIEIDRADFDKLVRWYVKKQRLPKRRKE